MTSMYDHRVCPQETDGLILLEIILKVSAHCPSTVDNPDGQHWVNHPDVRLRSLRAILTLRRYLSTLEYLP